MKTLSFKLPAASRWPQWKPLAIVISVFLCASLSQAQFAEPNDMGVTFAHMHLNVTDAALHKALWVDLFDGVLIEKAGYAAVRIPNALIFLTEKTPTGPSERTATDHFGFAVRDLDSILATWRAQGYEAVQETSGADRPTAYLTMPDGATLALEEDSTLAVTAAMNHVHLVSPQHLELMAWYADLFGAEPHEDSGATAHLPGATLRFGASEEAPMPTDGTAIDHIGFEVDDMETFAEWLRSKGIEFVFGPRYIESLDLWVAFFPDPSGTLVEVTEGLDTY